jgi:glycosyltransferase involved in cell wall biosynthesis
MRICLVSQEYPPETAHGGIGSQTWTKAYELAARGHEVHVLSSSTRPERGLRTERVGDVTVHRQQPPGQEFAVYDPVTFNLGYTWEVLRSLAVLMRDAPFDVLDFAEYGAEGYAYQIDRGPWNWAPVVVQLHGPLSMFAERIGWPEADSDFHRIGAAMEELSIQRADALMACSANIAGYTAVRHGVAREEIDVVHCGVDARAFTPRPRRAGGRPTVLFAGNFAVNKGALTVFDAVLRLRDRHPGLRLQMLGKENSLSETLADRARAAGAGDSVEVVGFVEDRAAVASYHRDADVFCSAAQHEVGVANVYLEAMASGRPVVAGSTGGAPEAVRHGETGLLVEPGDVDATAAALDRILSDPALAERMGAAGRSRVDDYFAMDHYVDRVLATYERAIARSRERCAAAERAAMEGRA